MVRNREEEQHCMAFIEWCGLASNTIPELKALYHIPNGGARPHSVNKQGRRYSVEAQKMKRMGTKPGVWDYHLPVARCWDGRLYAGVWIEFKSDEGRISEEQKEWCKLMKAQGYLLMVFEDWEDAKMFVVDYLGMPQGVGEVGRVN